MEQRTYPSREYDVETVMKFGKHVNKSCREIYESGEDGAGYLNWMVNHFHNDTFTERFLSMLRGDHIEEVEEDDIPF